MDEHPQKPTLIERPHKPGTTAIITGIHEPDVPPTFDLSIDDAKKLVKYHYDIGFVSYEFHHDIILLMQDMSSWLESQGWTYSTFSKQWSEEKK